MRTIILFGASAIGLWLVWSAISGAYTTIQLRRKGVHGKGIVAEIIEHGGRTKAYEAVVAFTAADGKKYRTSGFVDGALAKGDSANVTYMADDPETAMLGHTPGDLVESFVWLFFACFCFIPVALMRVDLTQGPEAAMRAFVVPATWFAVIVVGGAGLAFDVSAVTWAAKRTLLFATGTKAEGTIVEIVPTQWDALDVMEFSTPDGERHRFPTTSGARKGDVVGGHYPVIYDAKNPATAAVTTFDHFWLGPLIMTLFGGVFTFLGYMLYVFLIKKPIM